MIRIDTPPMLRNDNAEDIKGLRNYLYRELDNLQTQLNMVQDETNLAIAEAAKTGGTATPTDPTGIREAPVDGKQYARQDGAWSEVEAGKGLTYVGTGKSVTFDLDGATAIVVYGTHSSVVYSTIIPVRWIGSTSNKFGIACSQTYLGLTVRKDGDTVTVSHDSYTLTCYTMGAVGGSGDTPGGSCNWDDIIGKPETLLYDAQQDGKIYARKDGAWAEVTVPSESYINGLIDAKLGVIENGSY